MYESIMTQMVEIIDMLEDLPSECPEISSSTTFKRMVELANKLEQRMRREAKELNKQANRVESKILTNKKKLD